MLHMQTAKCMQPSRPLTKYFPKLPICSPFCAAQIVSGAAQNFSRNIGYIALAAPGIKRDSSPLVPKAIATEGISQTAKYIDELQQQFRLVYPAPKDYPPLEVFTFYEGPNGLPCVFIQHPNGQSLDLCLHGATVLNWTTPDERDLIFTDSRTTFDPEVPITSGIPVAFPQVREGILPENGFAGRMLWDVVETGFACDTTYYTPDPIEAVPLTELNGGEPVDPLILIPDPAPYIKLRLRDNEYTRSMWPHMFELDYKITLMETDEFPDTRSNQSPGITMGDFPPFQKDWNDEPDIEDMSLHMKEIEEKVLPEDAAEAAARDAEQAEAEGTDEGEDGSGEKKKGKKKPKEYENETILLAGTTNIRNEPELQQPTLEPFHEDPYQYKLSAPIQLRFQWELRNQDSEDAPEMRFQIACLPHFVCEDLAHPTQSSSVKILGLGGKIGFDYAWDPRTPILNPGYSDYVRFFPTCQDSIIANAHDTDLYFCPGTLTHFRYYLREGLKDVLLQHLGFDMDEKNDVGRYHVALGAGKVAVPVRLNPGKTWTGEYVVRYHDQYWKTPIIGDPDPPVPFYAPSQKPRDKSSEIEEGENALVSDEDGNFPNEEAFEASVPVLPRVLEAENRENYS